MARPTHDEIIRDLTRDLAVLKEQMEQLRAANSELKPLNTKVALLEQQVADMRKGWETKAQRLWMILAPIVGGAIGALRTYLLNKK